MTPRAAKVLSRGIVTACVLMIAVDVVLLASLQRQGTPTEVVVVGDPGAPGMAEALDELEERISKGDVSAETPVEAAIFGVVGLVWAVTGSLIVSRQPRNRAGWIFCIVGAAVPVNGLAFAYVLFTFRLADGSLPAVEVAAILGEYSFAAVALVPLLFLLFPDGRPPSPRWAWAARLLVLGFVLAVGAFVLQPGPLNNLVDSAILYENPIGIEPFADGEPGSLLIPIGALLMLGTSLATVIAVRQRFRRAVGEERQQMRWLVAVATASGAVLALMLVMTPISLLLGFETEGPDPIADILWLLGAISVFLGIPAAYLVAIFRYGLWELDVVIRKAVVAALVVATLTAVGVLLLIAIPILVVGIRPDASAIPVLVGVVLGMLVGPIRRRARRMADRLVYGKRATPYEVLTAFGQRVGETYATEDVLPRMAQLLASGVGASSARVLLRVGPDLREAARWPADADAARAGEYTAPVTDQGEELGALSVSMPANDPMDPSKEKLVRDLASQAGLLLRNVKLVEDLRASRQRLVAAQNEERRRLERNIHDGVQQQLVALNVRLGLLARTATTAPDRAAAMATALQEQATTTLEELRDLARGIYPPLLADEGLTAALEAQARKAAVAVSVETNGVGRYPQSVESALYFCALEALNNVAKYADASRATVRLEQADGQLVLSVTDDGRGFDPTQVGGGTGLQGMADRLEAVGGSLEIDSTPGRGTTVRGWVPIRSA